jgi:predicted dehydrogenase
MIQDEAGTDSPEFNRRDFLRGASFGTMMMLMGGIPVTADAQTNAPAAGGDTGFKPDKVPVPCAVIGCGIWGREILQTLATIPFAPVAAICETYQPFLNRAKESAPKAATYQDYRKVLDDKSVEAVIVATPSHQHKEIVLAALQAGKHVYCEAPLASSVEDARAIAQAAKAAVRVNFQAGLQLRSDLRMHYVFTKIVSAGAAGKPVMARGQWHKAQSWRRPSPNPAREKEINWRLDKATSSGLVGEIGIHQLDRMNWFTSQLPAAVSGFGGILKWEDGRDVADTIQSVFEYPDKANFVYDCTLANSFEADCDVLFGTYAAIMMRDISAWIFKEVDSPLLGWEVYGAKEQFYKDTGFVLRADASKSVHAAATGTESPFADTSLNHSLKAFFNNCHITAQGVKNFLDSNGGDADGLAEYLPSLAKGRLPAASYKEGFEATVSAIKANDAIVSGRKIALPKETFEI